MRGPSASSSIRCRTFFHEDVPRDFIEAVFAAMRATPRHTYQLLTKRAERLEDVAAQLDWPANVWMGVSVESADTLGRTRLR